MLVICARLTCEKIYTNVVDFLSVKNAAVGQVHVVHCNGHFWMTSPHTTSTKHQKMNSWLTNVTKYSQIISVYTNQLSQQFSQHR